MRNHNRYITTPKNKRDTSSKAVEDFITIVLFSENHGYRMKSYGPVSLIKIGGKTILETQIEAIKASFYNFEIIVCSGFENQVHFNTNCCESARLCLNNTSNDKILFCSGFNLLRPFHLKGLNLDFCSVITQENNSDGAFEINAISNNGSLEQLSLGLKSDFWTEMFFVSGRNAIKSFYNILSAPDYKNRFLFEAINDVASKHDFATFKVETPVHKINNIKTFKRISEI